MRKVLLTCLSMLVLTGMAKSKKQVVETWPDGTPMDAWFQQATKVDVNTLGKQYVLTDYGVLANSPEVQTQKIQAVIDRCAQEGGGVIVVPEGTFMTGALFFKQGTHLHVRECGTLKGSERIIDFPVLAGVLDSSSVESAVYQQGCSASSLDVCVELQECHHSGCAPHQLAFLDESCL